MSFCQRVLLLTRGVLPSLAVLLILTDPLAGQQNPEKLQDWEQQLERLGAVPYLGFSETAVAESDTGVVLYDQEKAYRGYNLYCSRLSSEAFLMDMEGRVVHRWQYALKRNDPPCHVEMLENGDLIVIKKFQELLRLNWNSELIWKRKLEAHHDVTPAPDGSFYVGAREFRMHRGLRVRFAAIVHLTEDGEEIDSWSSYNNLAEIQKCFDTSSFLDTIIDDVLEHQGKQDATWLDVMRALKDRGRQRFDYFHLNSIDLLPATKLGDKDLRFQQGNLLICFRNVNQIAVLEKDTYRLVWAWGEGDLEWPHHPTMLENGHILIFDNGVQRQYSRVLELDPIAEAIVWEYIAEPPEDFYSFSRGSAQRLPNGNTLICESDNGRVFEVTEEGEVVWMWLNPVIRDRHREIVYRMLRIPFAQVDELLRRWWWE